jgi:AcrR family transcriptional regulator
MAKSVARPTARVVAADQRDKLISATERLLCSRGLACVTTRDIAREAKVAEGALYHHFGDKADLIMEVVLHGVGEFREVLESLPLQVGQNTVQKNLERVVESAFRFHHRIASLVCSLFADRELLGRVRDAMNERCIGPGRTASILAGYLRAEQRLGRVSALAVVEPAAELLLAASFNRALHDHFYGLTGEARVRRHLYDAVRALLAGLNPENSRKSNAARRSA